jgi:hypothetical protein
MSYTMYYTIFYWLDRIVSSAKLTFASTWDIACRDVRLTDRSCL